MILFQYKEFERKGPCYVPLCPPFRYVRKQILSFRCVRMRTKRNDWYVPLCPLFRYVRKQILSFRCVRMRTKRNDWYVPLCPLFRYVRKQILSFRCVRMCIYTHNYVGTIFNSLNVSW